MSKLTKLQKETPGFTKVETVIILLIIVGAVLFGCLLFYVGHRNVLSVNTTNGATTTSNTDSSLYDALSPATVPSKRAECRQSITFSTQGVIGPIQCASGNLNVLAWNSLVTLEPKIMTLGYNATFDQVQAALCADVHANIGNPIEEANYQIASLYYGWSFSTDPSIVITNGTCVNVED